MNLNPVSPFSGKPLSDISAREGDAWCAKLLGLTNVEHIQFLQDAGAEPWCYDDEEGNECTPVPRYHSDWAAAGPLMERDEWPVMRQLITSAVTPTLAIRNAFIIAAEHGDDLSRAYVKAIGPVVAEPARPGQGVDYSRTHVESMQRGAEDSKKSNKLVGQSEPRF